MRALRKVPLEASYALFRWSGLSLLLQRKQPEDRAAILVYHNPKASSFEQHMAFLDRHCSLISLDQLAQAVASDDWSGVPRKAVVVTLDDGHAGNHDLLESCKRVPRGADDLPAVRSSAPIDIFGGRTPPLTNA